MGSPDEEVDNKTESSKPSETKNSDNKGTNDKNLSKEKDSKNKQKEGKKDRKKYVDGIKIEKRSSKSPDMEFGRTSTGIKQAPNNISEDFDFKILNTTN